MNLRSIKKERVQTLKSKLKEVASSAILDAAEEVFADVGLDARMETIAARAGVSVGTLYNHFSDRETLVEALAASRRAAIFAAVTEAVAGSVHTPFRERLIRVMLALCNVAGSQARFRRRLMENGGAPGVSKRHREGQEFFKGVLEPSFIAARKSGLIAPDPHQLQLPMFLGLVKAALTASLDQNPPVPVQELARVVVDSYLDGVSK